MTSHAQPFNFKFIVRFDGIRCACLSRCVASSRHHEIDRRSIFAHHATEKGQIDLLPPRNNRSVQLIDLRDWCLHVCGAFFIFPSNSPSPLLALDGKCAMRSANVTGHTAKVPGGTMNECRLRCECGVRMSVNDGYTHAVCQREFSFLRCPHRHSACLDAMRAW